MGLLLRLVTMSLVLIASSVAAITSIDEITTLRLAGHLDEARISADQLLAVSISASEKILVHLELAKILDRIGLHQNTRPVSEALANIELAADLSTRNAGLQLASVKLAFGDYYYRAEMQEREVTLATRYVNEAIALFHAIDDFYGEAEAVHRLGLIRLQQRELESAGELFDESLRLDQLGGERVFFRGEYERHIGFVHQMSGDTETALPHYENSLKSRISVGAIDASMFAAITLASALNELDQFDAAQEQLEYATRVATEIDSPAGKSRVRQVQAQIDKRKLAQQH